MKTLINILFPGIFLCGLIACDHENVQESKATELGKDNSEQIDVSTTSQLGFSKTVEDVTARTYSPKEFVDYVKAADHLNKSKTIGTVEYRLTSLPSEYMACNELKSNEIEQTLFEETLKEYEGTEYYMLQIEVEGSVTELAKVNLSSQEEYQQRIVYLSFGMQSDLKAVNQDGVEIPCSIYHFERTYNITPFSTFLIGFDEGQLKDATERTIVLEDNLFENGLIKFNWSTNQLKNIPQIKLL